MEEMTRQQCHKCGQVAYGLGSPHLCASCYACYQTLLVRLGPMDWRLFQIQRSTLLSLISDDRMTDAEVEHLQGILHLTDHIVDTARKEGVEVPSLNDVVLDRLAEA